MPVDATTSTAPADAATPAGFVGLLGRERASAILRCDDQRMAAAAMEAAVRAGFRVVEFTLTIPGALELVADFARRGDVVVGAGTVLAVEQAEAAVAAGARFLVSPVVDAAVIRRAGELGVAAMPGAHTPTEMLAAHHAGAPLLKLFPAPAGGAAWLRSVLAPLPFLKVVPTNGVDAGNAGEWLAAGAFAAGFVAPLFPADALARRDWGEIEARGRRILAAVRGAPPATDRRS
ncbi:MAG TPA: 2-dehydro-3-deoxyphosphogluconate aldolase [Thermoanaerobaculia bacterium]|nr:2-dehydro-3-deoxyphosphogluconate aldolase [Thermoanaerobaculia bacterium]